MAKRGMLGEIASKTIEAGSVHAAKVLSGEETLPEAAGAAVEDLLSGSKGKSFSKIPAKAMAKATKMAAAGTTKSKKAKVAAAKNPAPKRKASGKKSRSK